MGKRLCLTFSVYYFVHSYNITALMICQHVFWTFTFFYKKLCILLIVHPIFPAYSWDIIKVSQQFITTQPLHEMADWQTITYILSFQMFISRCIFFIVFVHYIAHFTLILRINSPAPLQQQNPWYNCINDNPERNRYSRLSPSLCSDRHAPDLFQT